MQELERPVRLPGAVAAPAPTVPARRALAGHPGVPEAVVRRRSTAGLWPGQTDAQEIGVTCVSQSLPA